MTIMVVAVAIMLALYAFFQYTPIGLAMRGTSEDHELAQSLGLRKYHLPRNARHHLLKLSRPNHCARPCARKPPRS